MIAGGGNKNNMSWLGRLRRKVDVRDLVAPAGTSNGQPSSFSTWSRRCLTSLSLEHMRPERRSLCLRRDYYLDEMLISILGLEIVFLATVGARIMKTFSYSKD